MTKQKNKTMKIIQNKNNIDCWEKLLENPPLSYIELFKQERNYLRNNISSNQKVLDIGCGNGRNILSIADITRTITGVDIDSKAVEDTEQNTIQYPKIKVVQGNVTSLPLKDKSFDVVIFSMTLVNLDNQKEKALSEMKRVIKDNGKIIISVYSEKALSERRKIYSQVGVPIINESNGKFIFDKEGFVSEQFSMKDIRQLIKPIGLKIIDHEEVGDLAYIFTLKNI